MWQDNAGLIGRGAGGARSCSCRAGKGGGGAGEGGDLQENLRGGGSPAKAWGGAGLILQLQIKALSQLNRRKALEGARGGRQQASPENSIVCSFIGYSLIYACTRERTSLEGITMEWQQLPGVIQTRWFKF